MRLRTCAHIIVSQQRRDLVFGDWTSATYSCRGTRGRLIFALDATASRQRTWDRACELQAGMFQEVAAIGGLDIQLVYTRPPRMQRIRWVSDARTLARLMEKINSRGGHTQIGRVL